MKETQRGASGRYRDVSELCIQFLCEHRFFLRQMRGQESSDASRVGERLHREVGLNPAPVRSMKPLIRALIVIVTVAAAILWVMG
jgi:hypothetical protein